MLGVHIEKLCIVQYYVYYIFRTRVPDGWSGGYIPVPLTGVHIDTKLINFTTQVKLLEKIFICFVTPLTLSVEKNNPIERYAIIFKVSDYIHDERLYPL